MDKRFTKSSVVEFLNSVSVMSVSCVMNGKPISSVLLFYVDDELNFYFATRRETYKARALFENPKISLSVWNYGRMLVQADGVTNEVMDESEIGKRLDILADKAARLPDFWPPVLSFDKGQYVLFKITPHWVRALDISELKIKEEENIFVEIDLNVQ